MAASGCTCGAGMSFRCIHVGGRTRKREGRGEGEGERAGCSYAVRICELS